jgi:hypothetical protein
MVLATGAESALRNANAGADLGEIKRPVWIFRKKLREPRDDCLMAAGRRCGFRTCTFSYASHQEMRQMLFERTRRFRLIENIRRVVSKLPDHLVELQKTRHQGRAWSNDAVL